MINLVGGSPFVIPPKIVQPPAASATAPSTDLWDVAKNAAKWGLWLSNPAAYGASQAIEWAAGEWSKWGQQDADNGNWVLGGLETGVSKLLGVADGIVNLPATLVDLTHASVMAGERAASTSGSDIVGTLAGIGYGIGSVVGVTQMTEAVMNQNFVTGEEIGGTADRWGHFLGGASAFLMAGAGVMESLGMDACLGGPKLWKDGCFTAGTLVLTSRGRKPIEQLAIGQRVITDPVGSLQRTASKLDPTTLRVLRLEYTKPETNEVLTMAFLRKAAEAAALQPGDTTPIILEEMGIEGQARVIAIEPCPTLEDGDGELVTATFTQQHLDIRLLHLTGLDQPIEVTGSHPIFSEDRKDFVAAKDLLPGERLRTRTGIATIERIDRKPGSWQVFNLEIGSIHRYYVSTLDVLVHNTCGGETEFTATGRQAHDAYSEIWKEEGYKTNTRLPSGLRPDAVKYISKAGEVTDIFLRELKPENARAESLGLSQLQKYSSELQATYPKARINIFLDTYSK